MKINATYGGVAVSVYVLELCHYGERGDFEVFPDKPLTVDLHAGVAAAAAAGATIDYADRDTLIATYPDGVICSAFADGRVIVENVTPPSPLAAFAKAVGLIRYELKGEPISGSHS